MALGILRVYGSQGQTERAVALWEEEDIACVMSVGCCQGWSETAFHSNPGSNQMT
jgi:hypothetical protein